MRSGRVAARHFTRSQCAAVQALIAPSEPMRAVLTDYGVTTPIHVLPTGLAADRFRAGDGGAFRAAAGIAPAASAGDSTSAAWRTRRTSASWYAGFARVRERVPEALLVIAGEGPARESLRAQVAALGLARKRCTSSATSSATPQLLDCYAAADVFVFASRTETQGLVLLEAMAQGAPVVSTAELGTRSILVPGCGALVVPEETRGVRRRGGAGAHGCGACAQELAGRGRAYARTWSSAAMARRLSEIYGSCGCAASCARATRAGRWRRGLMPLQLQIRLCSATTVGPLRF